MRKDMLGQGAILRGCWGVSLLVLSSSWADALLPASVQKTWLASTACNIFMSPDLSPQPCPPSSFRPSSWLSSVFCLFFCLALSSLWLSLPVYPVKHGAPNTCSSRPLCRACKVETSPFIPVYLRMALNFLKHVKEPRHVFVFCLLRRRQYSGLSRVRTLYQKYTWKLRP